MKQVIFSVFVFAAMASCGPSTQIEKSWKDPGAPPVDKTAKVFVVATVKDETSRRVIEDQLVKRIGSNAVASYTFLTPDVIK